MITDVAGRRAQDLLDSASQLRCKGTTIRGRAVSLCPTLWAKVCRNVKGGLCEKNQLSDNKRGEKRKNRCKSGDWDESCGMMSTVDCNLSTV